MRAHAYVVTSCISAGLAAAAADWGASAFGADPPAGAARPATAHPRHITPETREAIRRGLAWLAQRQSREGFWTDDTPLGSYSVTMTALATLALSASGSTPTQGPYAPQISGGMSYLVESAQDDGLISRGGDEEGHSMYGHGFSMLTLAQLYGMEADRQRMRRLHTVLQKAVTLTDRAQSSRGGWFYTPSSGFDEGSVTVTQVQGLRACRNVGIAVPKRVIDGAMDYLENSALPDGGIAYRVGMTEPRPPITAAAVVCWYNAGLGDGRLCRRNIRFCIEHIGAGNATANLWGHFYYAHLYMAQAMWLSGDKNWDAYFPRMRDRLLSEQGEDGAWDGDSAGRVYGTSIALIILQLPYQVLPIMQR